MDNTAHVLYEHATDRDSICGSGDWAFDDGARTARGHIAAVASRRISSWRLWGCVFTVISSLSHGADPWVDVQRQRAQLTMAGAFQPYGRRRITSREARRLALEILYRAEAERAAIAQAEAERGVNWEEVS